MTRRAFVRSCWVPAAMWAATLLYIRPYDGWGAWAAAPLLLPSLLLSALWGIAGLILLGFDVAEKRRVDLSVLAATIVGASVMLYYTVRYLIRQAG